MAPLFAPKDTFGMAHWLALNAAFQIEHNLMGPMEISKKRGEIISFASIEPTR
ncbi:MAG: hypothetical protein JWR26_3651 [Pedosphaera sp.]|nr:hypothetical protein [Pedosphaera sp.]